MDINFMNVLLALLVLGILGLIFWPDTGGRFEDL